MVFKTLIVFKKCERIFFTLSLFVYLLIVLNKDMSHIVSDELQRCLFSLSLSDAILTLLSSFFKNKDRIRVFIVINASCFYLILFFALSPIR